MASLEEKFLIWIQQEYPSIRVTLRDISSRIHSSTGDYYVRLFSHWIETYKSLSKNKLIKERMDLLKEIAKRDEAKEEAIQAEKEFISFLRKTEMENIKSDMEYLKVKSSKNRKIMMDLLLLSLDKINIHLEKNMLTEFNISHILKNDLLHVNELVPSDASLHDDIQYSNSKDAAALIDNIHNLERSINNLLYELQNYKACDLKIDGSTLNALKNHDCFSSESYEKKNEPHEINPHLDLIQEAQDVIEIINAHDKARMELENNLNSKFQHINKTLDNAMY